MNAPQRPAPNNALTPPAASTAEPLQGLLWRRLVDFFPVIMALALVLGTLWLVKSMPQAPASQTNTASKEPDLFLRDFEIRRYDASGQLINQLAGKEGAHYPDTDTFRVQDVKTWSVDKQGTVTQGSANSAVTDRKGENIELFNQVRVEQQPAAKPGQAARQAVVFQSEYLKSTKNQTLITTDKPVTITRGGSTISGTGLDYTRKDGVVEVQGRVRAVIPPPTR